MTMMSARDIQARVDEVMRRKKKEVLQEVVLDRNDGVEITVKVKRWHNPSQTQVAKGGEEQGGGDHNNQKRLPTKAIDDKCFRKGSWGDLLTLKKEEQKPRLKHGEIKQDGGGGGDGPPVYSKQPILMCKSPKLDNEGNAMCYKVPLSAELYLESHTHVVRHATSKTKTTAVDVHSSPKEFNDGFLEDKSTRRLKMSSTRNDQPDACSKNNYKCTVSRPSRGSSHPPQKPFCEAPLEKSPEAIISKKSKTTPTGRKSHSSAKHGHEAKITPKSSEEDEKVLRMENEKLRTEAAALIAKMQETRQEHQESISTIKELYRLADLLKRENQQLLGTQQTIQSKLLSATEENEKLKECVGLLEIKQQDLLKNKVDQNKLTKYKLLVRDLKSTIEEEIRGLAGSETPDQMIPNQEQDAIPESLRGNTFSICEGDPMLSDTYANEVQQILASYQGSSASHSLLSQTSQLQNQDR